MRITTQQKLELIATGCRNSLATFADRPGSIFEGFPRAACGPASEVLGRILSETLQLEGEYVCGESHPGLGSEQSHAWFEAGDYLIDITHDQFAGTGLNGWVFAKGSPWHAQFDCDRRAGFCDPEHWSMYPHEAYEVALVAAQRQLHTLEKQNTDIKQESPSTTRYSC